ncbi:hypothetical protein AU074_06705 [Pseudomonas sp. ATCC PTA-122608]|nr:hypothetical protein AU074_06705 [Pseudomonas sp. ATCC PTA-122608]
MAVVTRWRRSKVNQMTKRQPRYSTLGGAEDRFQLPGQFARLAMATAKALDASAGHFKDMKEVSSGRQHTVERRMQATVVGV